MAGAHVFVGDLDDPRLGADDLHHLSRVLRLRMGEEVTAADNAGGWRSCRFRGSATLEPAGPLEWRPPPGPAITVAFSLTKGERPEWTVQKLTELGVDRIIPMVSARSVVRWDEHKAARQLERLTTVARQAAMQSRRDRLPVVSSVLSFDDAVQQLGPATALAQAGGRPPELSYPSVLIGPEGGWSPTELSCGLPAVGLGPTVLRAETAAVAAGVLLTALRCGSVRAAGDGMKATKSPVL